MVGYLEVVVKVPSAVWVLESLEQGVPPATVLVMVGHDTPKIVATKKLLRKSDFMLKKELFMAYVRTEMIIEN